MLPNRRNLTVAGLCLVALVLACSGLRSLPDPGADAGIGGTPTVQGGNATDGPAGGVPGSDSQTSSPGGTAGGVGAGGVDGGPPGGGGTSAVPCGSGTHLCSGTCVSD